MKKLKLFILSLMVITGFESFAQCNQRDIIYREDVLKEVDKILTRAINRRAFFKQLKFSFVSEFKTDQYYWNEDYLVRRAVVQDEKSGVEFNVLYKIWKGHDDYRFKRKYDKYGRFLGCTALLDRDVEVRNPITNRLVIGFLGLNNIQCTEFDCKPVKLRFDQDMNLITK